MEDRVYLGKIKHNEEILISSEKFMKISEITDTTKKTKEQNKALSKIKNMIVEIKNSKQMEIEFRKASRRWKIENRKEKKIRKLEGHSKSNIRIIGMLERIDKMEAVYYHWNKSRKWFPKSKDMYFQNGRAH